MDAGKPYSLLDEMLALAPARGQVGPAPVMHADFGDFFIVELSFEEWQKYQDHPRRRDPEKQSDKAHWDDARDLRGPLASERRRVVGAQLENDGFYKVDGHCRTLLWERGELPKPGSIIATVFRCTSHQALLELRSGFDSASAATTSSDNVTAALHEFGLVLGSPRLRGGAVSEALEIAVRGKPARESLRSVVSDRYDPFMAVECFRSELKSLDDCAPSTELFLTGHVAAALLSLAENYGARDFFSLYAKGQGKSRRGELDPVAYLTQWTEQARKGRSVWLRNHQYEVCGIVLALVNRFLQGPDSAGWWIPRGAAEPAPVDVEAVAERVQRSKDRLLGR